ncbi:hypothetical protein H4R35_003810 [Dimargaris xerosporica]|nr:hypothetical protein H4R35_003810 [Dimargaris xerosporica]
MRYGITLLLLVTVAMGQTTPPGTPGSEAIEGVSKLPDGHVDPNQSLPTFKEHIPREILTEILKKIEPNYLRGILTTSPQFYNIIVQMLGLDRKTMETKYLRDPTISNKAKQEFHALRQADPTAEPQKFNKYLWRQLQFRWNRKLLPIVWGLSPSQKADMVIDNLPHDVINLGELYLQQAQVLAPHTIAGNPTPLDSTLYPDIFKGLPVAPRPDYGDVAKTFQQSFGYKVDKMFFDIGHGFLGAFNAGYVMEIPNLVKKYVEIINQVDLLPFIQQRHAEPIYGILAKDIAHNDPDRIRYFFNDIMAFHVIPKLIMAHVAKGYYDQALIFINEILESEYLKEFFGSIKVDTGLNYYERAAYMALRQPMNEDTTNFVKRVLKQGHAQDQEQERGHEQKVSEFRVNRLYQCMFSDDQRNTVIRNLDNIFDKELLQAQVDAGECQRFAAQFERGVKFMFTPFLISMYHRKN